MSVDQSVADLPPRLAAVRRQCGADGNLRLHRQRQHDVAHARRYLHLSCADRGPPSRATKIGAANPTYDANGNLFTDGTPTFGWDAGNRLESVVLALSSVDYFYGPDGARAKKAAPAYHALPRRCPASGRTGTPMLRTIPSTKVIRTGMQEVRPHLSEISFATSLPPHRHHCFGS